jgi:mycothiol synthase
MNMEEPFKKLIEAGYQVRPASIQDLPLAVPMFNAAEAELAGAGDWTVERYELEWQQTGIDLETSTRIVFEPSGLVVGCVELWDQFNPPARPWIWGRVHPQWKGRGIGSAMLTWAFNTCYRALARLPEDVRLAPQVAAPAHHTPSIELFEGAGMRLCRYTWRMLTDLKTPVPEPQWPQGIQIRTLRYPEDLEQIYRVQEEAFQEHWGYIRRPFEEGFQRWRTNVFDTVKLKPELWFVAVEGERIVGFINSQERHDVVAEMGYIPTLAVLKPFRRRGLGQALLQHAFQALQERGVQRVGLDVDAKNKTGANRLYQRVGMQVDQEIMHYEIELRPGRELAVVE